MIENTKNKIIELVEMIGKDEASTSSANCQSKNVPKLRFKEFDSEWVEKKFADIYSFIQTNSFSRALLDYDIGEVKNIHYGDIHTKFHSNFYIHNEKVPFIFNIQDSLKIKEDSYCLEKDLVIADASEDYKDIGKAIELIALDNQKIVAGLHTYIARDINNNTVLGFSGYLMQSYRIRKQMMTLATGTSVLGLSKTNLAKIKINLPTLPEQTKIADCLSTWDRAIENAKLIIENKKLFKKGMMQKIFSQEIRFKPDTSTPLSASDGGEFPDWIEKRLGDLPIYISDGNYGEQYPTAEDFKKTGVPFLRANNIRKLKVDNNDTRFIAAQQHSKLTSGHLVTNDILITTRGELGNIALIDIFHNGSNINAQICLLRITDVLELNYLYLLYVLDHRDSKIQYTSFSTGTALKQLPKGSLKKIKIKIPNIKEQTKIANFLSFLDNEIDLLEQELAGLQLQKKGLMQGMFV